MNLLFLFVGACILVYKYNDTRDATLWHPAVIYLGIVN